MEIYQLPTAQSYLYNGCSYRPRTNQRTLDNAVTVDNIVLYERTGEIESGQLGIVFACQIAQSIIANDPDKGYIVIDGKAYQITSTKLMKNPAYLPYWQCELKTTKVLG